MACSNELSCQTPLEFEVDTEEANGFFEGDCEDSPFEYEEEDSESNEDEISDISSDDHDHENPLREENEDGDEANDGTEGEPEGYELGLGPYMFEPRRRPGADENQRPPDDEDRQRLETTDWYVLVLFIERPPSSMSRVIISCYLCITCIVVVRR